MKNKKGYSIGMLPTIAITFAVAVLVLSIVSDITGEVRDDQTVDSYEYNVSTNGLGGLAEIGDWLDTIGLVIAAAVVIGILGMLFTRRLGD